MKFSLNRALSLAVIAFAALLAFTSCSKSNNGGVSGSMSATVGTTAWANNQSVIAFYANASGLFQLAGIQFKGGDSTTFALEFTSPVVLNHPFSSDTASLIVAYTDSKSQAGYGALVGVGHAVVTVTSYDSTGHSIGGTFSGVLYNTSTFADSITVTNGK